MQDCCDPMKCQQAVGPYIPAVTEQDEGRLGRLHVDWCSRLGDDRSNEVGLGLDHRCSGGNSNLYKYKAQHMGVMLAKLWSLATLQPYLTWDALLQAVLNTEMRWLF